MAQGQPPAHYSALESSWRPPVANAAQQYSDWSNSLHSQTMTAGVQWQLHLLPQDQANKCLDCHAPLAEQKALVALQQQWPAAPQAALPDYVPADLSNHGLVCAACHVRGQQRFGPLRRDGSGPVGLAHNGFYSPAGIFRTAVFVPVVISFPMTARALRVNYAKIPIRNGWPVIILRRVFNARLPHAGAVVTNGRGIHTPEMVGRALTMDLQQQGMNVVATLRNTGAGHNFPHVHGAGR